jgi:hypothetical protein
MLPLRIACPEQELNLCFGASIGGAQMRATGYFLVMVRPKPLAGCVSEGYFRRVLQAL